MDLFEKVSKGIRNAMRAKDKVVLEILRNVKKFFLEAKTAPGANDILTDADTLKIVQKLVKQGEDTAEIYIRQGRQDLADAGLAQVQVIETCLPRQMAAEELEIALKEIIAEVGATSGKDMGKVMGVAPKKLTGLAKGRATSTKIKELLGQSRHVNPAYKRSYTVATLFLTRNLSPDVRQDYIRGQIVYRHGLSKPNEVHRSGQEILIK